MAVSPDVSPDVVTMAPGLGGLLRLSSAKIHETLMERLHEAGFSDVSPTAFPLFFYPAPRGARPAELIAKMGISKQSLNHILVAMEQAGYIRRKKAESGRGRQVWLTELGEAFTAVLTAACRDMERQLKKALTTAEYDRLLQTLRYITWDFEF
jgi:DNA-binding MarR family transcriptional regulator